MTGGSLDVVAEAFLRKAGESLKGAESECANGRYNNCANRAYYSAFQAAISALARVGVRPTPVNEEWGHAFVQRQFVGLLINRRKLYSGDLRGILSQLIILRELADHKVGEVSRCQALHSIERARTLVEAVENAIQGGRPLSRKAPHHLSCPQKSRLRSRSFVVLSSHGNRPHASR